ncbi:MAG: AAA family ATPase [Dysgonamonadaceae bacterium]|jgi:AAA+ ATPase superfamily predicted ATPase|nr:AAA family ATPase [Dysgonamonadaceae bacterium]
MEIIGRYSEQKAMQQHLESDKPEFVAVYGRRRVGKTFLIKEFFKQSFVFYVTGLANASKKEQIKNFNVSLNHYGKMPYPREESWMETFRQLIHLLEHSRKKGKKVIFIDELPWFDTPRSGFITALEHFWNSWASSRPEILLIVCGSATSWMINKLIKNHGGLHNRVTRRMLISPFTLGECEKFFRHKKIILDKRSIVESYMIFGGIPFYLDMMEKGLSLAQNVDKLCFSKNGALRDEFSILYASLFKHAEKHIKIVKVLGKKAKGLTRDEIIKGSKLQGGGLSNLLEELEQCGFIRKYQSFEKKNKYPVYQLVDFYTLFYLHFIRPDAANKYFWTNMTDNARHRAWSGYAFELVCLMHEDQIKHKLGISGVLTHTASWRSLNVSPGAQIDLIIDRNDRVINLCEMKYANDTFVIDRKYGEILRNKRDAFVRETKTRKAIHLTLLTTYGVKQNDYYGLVQSEVKMEDLF